MKALLLAAMALILSAASTFAHSQTAKKTTVYFHCNCTDSVGGQLATAFRDQLATSPRFVQTTDRNDQNAWHLTVISMDPDKDETSDNHNWTVYADTITMGPVTYITNGIHSCGARRVNDCAATLLSNLDQVIIEWNQQ
jgi:hypothetical protein